MKCQPIFPELERKAYTTDRNETQLSCRGEPIGPASGCPQSETDSTCLASVHENSMRIPGHQREEEASEENKNVKALYLVLKCGAVTLPWFLYSGKLTFRL